MSIYQRTVLYTATEFAIDMGIPQANLTIQPEIDRYNRWISENCQPNFRTVNLKMILGLYLLKNTG